MTALKREIVSEAEIEDAVAVAATLNEAARDAMQEVGASAATDVTGYGFLDHLTEMVEASGASLGALVRRGRVPVWEWAVPLANNGVHPGGLKNNREYLEGRVEADGVNEEDLLPLYDPQTSGGLLVAVPEGRASALVRALEKRGAAGVVVGEVVQHAGVRVTRQPPPFSHQRSAGRSGNVTVGRGRPLYAERRGGVCNPPSPQEVLGLNTDGRYLNL